MANSQNSFLKILAVNLVVALLTSLTVSLYISSKIDLAPTASGLFVKQPAKLDLEAFQRDLGRLTVRIYTNKNTGLPRVYKDEDIIAFGAAITADGWIIMPTTSQPASGLIILVEGNRLFTVDKLVNDSASGFSFAKILANDLAVANLARTANLGDQLITLGLNARTITLRSLATLKSKTITFSSETYPYLWEVDQTAPGAIFNQNKELVGLVVSDPSKVIPIKAIADRLNRVLFSTNTKPLLGVNYVDLARFPTDITGTKVIRSGGALLTDTITQPAVLKNSPAEKAGLKAGEIIVRINDSDLTLKNNLTQYILSLPAGEEVELTVLAKDKKERLVKVKLGS
ncbi:PDZ domain-containing protein [Candidatus Uhrbacteria bacterium]|nr:PDZ domain-containing protein [Candidatus Uhrbacteria bacterium]